MRMKGKLGEERTSSVPSCAKVYDKLGESVRKCVKKRDKLSVMVSHVGRTRYKVGVRETDWAYERCSMFQ